MKKFIADYKAKYGGKTPDAMAVLGYDAMKLMADAIRRAGSTDGAKIRDALAATRDFPAVSGHITIDADRNARKDIVIVQIRDGQFRFVESIAPDASLSLAPPWTSSPNSSSTAWPGARSTR